jgi:hypothetical protein
MAAMRGPHLADLRVVKTALLTVAKTAVMRAVLLAEMWEFLRAA